ncbi:MAG: flagellar basal body L-ring protein FlgH [Candidatus Polarisedimenticolaceae bacterium]|nr:flagellar basal body L-ring protein FlgH [Candidatus Polarisedimenticolaceae bacterium]
MKRAITIAVIALSLLLLAGCNSAPKRDPDYAPVRPVAPPPVPQGNGAIYQSGFQMSWFEDMRARRIGDLLTIKLAERTDATKTATTEITRSNASSVTNPSILGVSPEFSLPGILPLSATKNLGLGTSLSSSTDFTGEGDSAQSNKLTGEITVTVIDVLPNGYLMVRGEKRIGINRGNEYIKLSGIVRPADIDSTNTVLSTKMADPTIVYVGDGEIASANTMGWLARFFISALFPF